MLAQIDAQRAEAYPNEEASLAAGHWIGGNAKRQMPFVVLDPQGKPLADPAGKMIVVASKADALLMPGDQGVFSWDWWVAQSGEDTPAG